MAGGNGLWHDWIGDFLAYSEEMASPHLYRLWSAIYAIGASVERRVFLRAYEHRETYANLYVLLVGAPGVGKQVIDDLREMLAEVCDSDDKPLLALSPDSMSKASMIDSIARSKRTFFPADGGTLVYHSMHIVAEEFQFLLPAYDMEYISLLNKLFNNPQGHQEVRRTGLVKDVTIVKPQLTILAGAQPAYFVSTFPEEAWSTGFARRIIMVYSAEGPHIALFKPASQTQQLRTSLIARLRQLALLSGQASWTPSAASTISSLHDADIPPQPSHSKLVHYNRSRTMHLLKLSLISAISRTGLLLIDEVDVKRALEWLLQAERLMPDIFREMIGKSDAQVIEELHYFVQSRWSANRGKAVHSQLLWDFLSKRVPSMKIESILLTAVKSNVLTQVSGADDLWLPRPRSEHSVE